MEFILLLLVLLFLLPTLLMSRNQRKRQAELLEIQQSLEVGEFVITGSGAHGKVHSLTETTVDLEVASGTVVTFERAAILKRRDSSTEPEALN